MADQLPPEGPFSKELLDACTAFFESDDEEVKREKLYEISTLFSNELDSSNHEVAEDIHELVHEFDKIHAEVDRISMKLGRHVLRVMAKKLHHEVSTQLPRPLGKRTN